MPSSSRKVSIVLGSALAGSALTLAVLFALAFFAGQPSEMSMSITNETYERLFLSKLAQVGIDHRKDSSGQIWYPTEDGEEVNKIFQSVLRENSFIGFYTKGNAESFRELLDKNEIDCSIEKAGAEWNVFFSAENSEAAKKLMHEMFYSNAL